MNKEAQNWIDYLGLEPHPEGGYFKETYRSDTKVEQACLPERFEYDHNIATAIYFMITSDSFSAFHCLKADEIWHFYAGQPVSIYVIQADGTLRTFRLGIDPAQKMAPQAVVQKDQWFAAVTEAEAGYSLVGCTVSPGFSFKEGFVLGKKEKLLRAFPQHKSLIEKYAKP